ncbi:hypothetical protein WN944_000857 [Citrus x changshan-huyou]|uniref:Uncharacterized protein n=1 Tax=Citrus x changshan-huyou TaxID=2935761 RepID=A0AAP0MDN2_9ROSI
MQTETKLSQERLGVVKKEFEDLTKKSWKIDNLMEAEMKVVEEELQLELRRVDELRVWRAAAAKKKTQLLEHTNSNYSCKKRRSHYSCKKRRSHWEVFLLICPAM